MKIRETKQDLIDALEVRRIMIEKLKATIARRDARIERMAARLEVTKRSLK
jgi:hypothetical protein